MSELLLIYIWLKLDSIATLCTIFTVVFVSTCVILAIISHEAYDDDDKARARKALKKLSAATICLAVLTTAIPSTKQMAILVASKVAIDVARSPEGSKLSDLFRKKANELLDEELKK